jgi:hypothetical protein
MANLVAHASLSKQQLYEAAEIAFRHAVYPQPGEATADFVMRLLRTLDRQPPQLRSEITILFSPTPSPPHLAAAAFWVARLGLAALGIYSVF